MYTCAGPQASVAQPVPQSLRRAGLAFRVEGPRASGPHAGGMTPATHSGGRGPGAAAQPFYCGRVSRPRCLCAATFVAFGAEPEVPGQAAEGERWCELGGQRQLKATGPGWHLFGRLGLQPRSLGQGGAVALAGRRST